MPDYKLEEYKMLREEMISLLERQDELTRFCYTIVGAIWTFAFTVKNEWILNIALMIILLISLRIVSYRSSVSYLVGYMRIYLEKQINIEWETHNKTFREKNPKSFIEKTFYFANKFDFCLITIGTVLLFWFMRNWNILIGNSYWITVFLIFIHFCIITSEFVILYSFSKFGNENEKNIDKWEEVLSIKNHKNKVHIKKT